MGIPDQDTKRPTFERRGSTFDTAVEEIFGGPQSKENFVVRPGEIRKALSLPTGRKTKLQNYRIRNDLGLKNGFWYNRQGLPLDQVEPFIRKLAKLHKQPWKANRASFYALMFYQIAEDLGDDGMPFLAAKHVLGEPGVHRWHNCGKGDEIFGYHPKMKLHKKMLSTTMTSTEEVRKLYDERFSC